MKRTKKQTTLTAHDSERMLNLRVPTALLARGDALVRMVAADTELPTTGRVTRSTVFRMALIEGLKVLERRYRR